MLSFFICPAIILSLLFHYGIILTMMNHVTTKKEFWINLIPWSIYIQALIWVIIEIRNFYKSLN